MKSIIMQRATQCSVLQFNCIPTNWKGSIPHNKYQLVKQYIPDRQGSMWLASLHWSLSGTWTGHSGCGEEIRRQTFLCSGDVSTHGWWTAYGGICSAFPRTFADPWKAILGKLRQGCCSKLWKACASFWSCHSNLHSPGWGPVKLCGIGSCNIHVLGTALRSGGERSCEESTVLSEGRAPVCKHAMWNHGSVYISYGEKRKCSPIGLQVWLTFYNAVSNTVINDIHYFGICVPIPIMEGSLMCRNVDNDYVLPVVAFGGEEAT